MRVGKGLWSLSRSSALAPRSGSLGAIRLVAGPRSRSHQPPRSRAAATAARLERAAPWPRVVGGQLTLCTSRPQRRTR